MNRPSPGGYDRLGTAIGSIEQDWRHRARCRDLDPEVFFPVGTTGPADHQTQKAKAICALCVVREECLQYALGTIQEAGVWGGLSEEERRTLRRGARRRRRVS